MPTGDTILNISGLPDGIEDEEYIQFHFAKKCGAGAEVKILSFNKADKTAVVSIKQLDSTAKQNLLTMEHKLVGTPLSVTERDQHHTANPSSSTAVSTQCTVMVHGLHYSDKDQAVDCLELYFSQNSNGSGGGEIVDNGIQILKGKGIITFVDSKVAERVVNNSPHSVMGQELKVVFAEEESLKQEPSNLLLKNIPPDTDIDFLELYMDNVTGLSCDNGDYQLLPKPGGLYLVIFNSALEIELSTIVKNISKKTIRKQSIEVEVITPSTSVVISNVIGKKRNEEYLKLYFTNSKFSGVSEYETLEILDDGRVIVHLHDQDSVQAVLQTKHNKLGPGVQLQVYDRFTLDEVEPNPSTQPEMPAHSTVKDEPPPSSFVPPSSLVPPSPSVPPKPIIPPKPVVPPKPILKKVAHVMVDFVQKSNPSLSEVLEKHGATVSINVDGESEVGFIHVLPSVGSEKVRNWNEECDATIESFFKSLSSSSLRVPSELLPKVKELVEENKSNTSLCISFAKDYATLHVAGDSNEVAKLVKEIKCIEDAELTREESIGLDAKKIAYIQAQADELREDNPDISFEINSDDTAVVVTGKKEDIGAFKQYMKQIKVCSAVVPFPEVILNYLFSTQDLTIISKLLQEQEDQCVPYFDQESNKLLILGSERPTASRLAKHLQQNINHEAVKNSSGVFEDKQFSGICEQLKEENDVYIEILLTEIRIIGRCQHTKLVKQNLEDYIQKEYFGKRKIEVSKGCWKFITQHLHRQWDKVMHKLNDSKYEDVMAHFPSDSDANNPVIMLEGEEALISVLHEEINALIESVCTNDPPMVIDRPGLFQFLKTKHANFAIKGIEASVPACIEITIKALEAADETSDGNVKVTNEVCKGTTKEGKRVILIKGEIENFKVDVIVNAANSDLLHGGGVALAISKKGGPKIQKDSYNYTRTHGKVMDGDAVLREEVGNLPCKRIIYAVGPAWQGGTHLEDRVLKRACVKSLSLAQTFESISFPAISSGLFKFPLNVSADTIVHAFCTWSEEFPHVTLRDIYVVVHDHAVQAFRNAMEKHLTIFSQQPHTPPTASVVSAPTVPKRKKKHRGNPVTLDDAVPVTTAPVIAGSAKHAPIEVCKGELLKQKAEAYVNTTSSDLVLSNGAVSKSILQAAGQALQDECSKHVSKNGRVQAGDIVVTGAGSIPCKHIIHTAGSNYDSSNTSNSEKILEKTIQSCLKVCDQRGVTSIAFPALGAGALGYPPKVVASVMISTVQNYFQTNTTSLRAVKFVIFMDNTYQEFQSFLASQSTVPVSMNMPVSVPQNVHSTYQPAPSSFIPPSSSSPSASQPSSEVFKTSNITVEIMCGDITDDDSDAFVNTTQSDLHLASGAVSKAILSKAGQAMQQSCSLYVQQYGQLDEGKVCVVQATGQLKCKEVFHIVAPNTKRANALNHTVMLCLKQAEHNKLRSIAIPAIGTGGLSYKPSVAAQGMCEAVIEFGITQPVHLQHIRIVIFLKDMHQVFVKKFNEISSKQSTHSQPSLLYRYVSHAMSYFTGGRSNTRSSHDKIEKPEVVERSYTPPIVEGYYTPPLSYGAQPTTSISVSCPHSSSVQIKVFAEDEKGVKEAEDQLLDIIDQHCEALPVDDTRIMNLRPDHVSQLTQKANEHNVSIEVETELSRIQLRGGKNDVQIVKAEIDRILHELDREKMKFEADATAADLMQKKIKWQYQSDDEKFEDYDAQANYRIEQAYQLYKAKNHGPVFSFKDQDGIGLEIIFNKTPMQEKDCTNGGMLTDVRRIDIEDKINEMLKKDEFPSTWRKDDENPQIRVISLDAKSQEYINVKNGFDLTSGGARTIVKIERVQNPTLYAQYAARKKVMDQTNPPDTKNERRLYHGCGEDSIQSIIHGGFNRSYAGKNATVHGVGVYFAVNASYSSSSTYSPPDANGNKYIFLALVLTGEYTTGNSKLRVPPAKDPNKSNVVLYDSVVDNISNPNMFVIFYDAQCYPEYLITFK